MPFCSTESEQSKTLYSTKHHSPTLQFFSDRPDTSTYDDYLDIKFMHDVRFQDNDSALWSWEVPGPGILYSFV